jgi:glutathione S-transferase
MRFDWVSGVARVPEVGAKPTIVGRSSSHFTRTARIFASELGVDHCFEVVRDLLSSEPGDYAGNPALRLPILRTSAGVWFGALGICRELARRSKRDLYIVWPEHLDQPLLANVQELTVQAMATEVALIMSKVAGEDGHGGYVEKNRGSLLNTMSWLDTHLVDALAALPSSRDLSYLEVTLFCLSTHLQFREVLPMARYTNLAAFCEAFSARVSASNTPYHFDT